MRGVSFVVAATFVAEVGDLRRSDNPRQLMSYLGLVPSERSTGDTIRLMTSAASSHSQSRGSWKVKALHFSPASPGAGIQVKRMKTDGNG